jgi:alanyl-tRNA synthetase
LRYRKVTGKGKELYQIVLDKTPFYAESGGQVGDTGQLIFGEGSDIETIQIVDTKKENDLIIHLADQLPARLDGILTARIDEERRNNITVHHSATHLMHAALREVLGKHVAQKGSLVNDEQLRFDFSHFAKVSDAELQEVEKIVNRKIRENIPIVIKSMPKDEAIKLGAMALFGEKYGDTVRVVIMDPNYSIELCGVRRIEAVSGQAAEALLNEENAQLMAARALLKNPKDLAKAIESLQEEKNSFQKRIESLEARQLVAIRQELMQKDEIINNVSFIGDIVEVPHADALKKLCFDFKNHLHDHVVVLCANIGGKAHVAIGISETVTVARQLDASKIIKEQVGPLINGGGGGQKTLATSGGQETGNLREVIARVKLML